jgi:hypothetical protein
MSAQNKKAVCGQANGLSETSTVRKPHSNTKKASVIKRFVELGDRGMTCFDAANKYHDYVLRSTVSGIQRDFGIEFRKEWTKVPNSFGTLTDCVRYWLDEGNRAKAINLFGFEEVL